MKVKFKDLSAGLKTAVVFAYVVGVTYAVAFIIGFFEGLLYL